MAADGHQIASERVHIHGNPADGLCAIDVKQRTRRGASGREWREILNRSDFGVRETERDKRRLAVERIEHAGGIDSSFGVRRDSHHLESAAF